MADTELKPMTDAEAMASIKRSLSNILASQKNMFKMVYDVSKSDEKEQFEKISKELEESLDITNPQKAGGATRRRRTRRRRHTRKF